MLCEENCFMKNEMAKNYNPKEFEERIYKNSGRFDRQVIVDMPDIKGREEILKVHAKGKKFASTDE